MMLDIAKLLIVLAFAEGSHTAAQPARLPVKHRGDEHGIYGERERNVLAWIKATGVQVTLARFDMDTDLQTEACIYFCKHDVGLRIEPEEFFRRCCKRAAPVNGIQDLQRIEAEF